MTDRRTALQGLAVGDIFHGRSPNGASLICLVTAVDDGAIYSRRITTQDDIQFDRETGIEVGDVPSSIDCVAPLPPDALEVLLAYDRKGQELAASFRGGIRPPDERYRLTPEERRAFHLLHEHVAANPV